MEIPFDLLIIVASFYTKPRMKLLDWIPEDILHWKYLSFNPNAIHMLEIVLQHDPINPLAVIDWDYLSENPNALHILEANPEKINWDWLSENPNVMHILEANPEKIDWDCLSINPNIFEIDTKQTQIYLIKKAKDIDYYL